LTPIFHAMAASPTPSDETLAADYEG